LRRPTIWCSLCRRALIGTVLPSGERGCVEAKDRVVCGVLVVGRWFQVCVLINSVLPVPAKLKPDSRVCLPCRACTSPLIPQPKPLAHF
jgi:hypothetical protein